MKPILGILGPTAVGKSKLALNLAQQINTEIISADSMQIYKKFDIGTAKASLQERTLVKHHLIDIAEPYENFSSYLFKIETEKVLKEFEETDKVPLIVGGTGFFSTICFLNSILKRGKTSRKYAKNCKKI